MCVGRGRAVFVCVLMSLPHGAMGWSVIMAFTGHAFITKSIKLKKKTTFCGFSMGRNQYWAGRVYVCVFII